MHINAYTALVAIVKNGAVQYILDQTRKVHLKWVVFYGLMLQPPGLRVGLRAGGERGHVVVHAGAGRHHKVQTGSRQPVRHGRLDAQHAVADHHTVSFSHGRSHHISLLLIHLFVKTFEND